MSRKPTAQQVAQSKRVQDIEDVELKAQETSVREVDSGSLSATVGRLLTLASFVGLVLAMLGYGVALAAEGRFGIPRAQLIDSTMDMWELSTWAVLQVAARGFTVLGDPSIYVKALQGIWPLATVILIGWLVLLAFLMFYGRSKKVPRRTSKKRHEQQQDIASVGYALKKTWFIPASVLATPLALVLGILAIIAVTTLLTIVPIVGMSAGEAHIDKFVVAPKVCFPVATREHRLEQQKKSEQPSGETGAQCVAVRFVEGDVQVKGRVVFALSKTLLLYDPATGAVLRVPTANAIIEVVSTL